jgi:hypothetical protein
MTRFCFTFLSCHLLLLTDEINTLARRDASENVCPSHSIQMISGGGGGGDGEETTTQPRREAKWRKFLFIELYEIKFSGNDFRQPIHDLSPSDISMKSSQ